MSWNFPGGSLTSKTEDYARLGRDVKLYELQPEVAVNSLADAKKHESENNGGITNPDEGEDAGEVAAMPEVSAGADDKQSETGKMTGQNDNDPAADGKYTMKHDVFPVRQIVSYMLSYKSRYGILSTGYRFDFIKLEVANKGQDDEQLVAYIAGERERERKDFPVFFLLHG